MRSAKELLDEVFEQGIQIFEDDGYLGWRSAQPLSQELINRLRIHKEDLLRILRNQQHQKAYLAENGELRVFGSLPSGTLFDTLLALKASDKEIERHVTPLQMPSAWQRWQLRKPSRIVN